MFPVLNAPTIRQPGGTDVSINWTVNANTIQNPHSPNFINITGDIISKMTCVRTIAYDISLNTQFCYYLGDFNLTRHYPFTILVASKGSSAGAGSEFTITRHYDRAPLVSGLLGENYLFYKFYYKPITDSNLNTPEEIGHKRAFSLYIQPVHGSDININVKIKSYDYSYNSTTATKISIHNNTECFYGQIQKNQYSGTTIVTTGTSTSDDRLKFNETNLTNSLNIIRNLIPVKYDQSNKLNEEINTFKNCGFIAQDVYEIDDLKDAVLVGDEEIPWKINYNYIYTYNVSATKELDQIVAAQATTIANLEQENATMKAALNELLTAAGKPTI